MAEEARARLKRVMQKNPYEVLLRQIVKNSSLSDAQLNTGITEDDYDWFAEKYNVYFPDRTPVQLVRPDDDTMYEGDCHGNSARYWQSHPHLRIVTGFAYGLASDVKDKAWRRHSWLLNDRDGSIIETTTLRRVYVGVPFTLKGSERAAKAWSA